MRGAFRYQTLWRGAEASRECLWLERRLKAFSRGRDWPMSALVRTPRCCIYQCACSSSFDSAPIAHAEDAFLWRSAQDATQKTQEEVTNHNQTGSARRATAERGPNRSLPARRQANHGCNRSYTSHARRSTQDDDVPFFEGRRLLSCLCNVRWLRQLVEHNFPSLLSRRIEQDLGTNGRAHKFLSIQNGNHRRAFRALTLGL